LRPARRPSIAIRSPSNASTFTGVPFSVIEWTAGAARLTKVLASAWAQSNSILDNERKVVSPPVKSSWTR
jgi:hypothetical protein